MPMYGCEAGARFINLEFRKGIWAGAIHLGVTSLQMILKATGPGGLSREAGGHRRGGKGRRPEFWSPPTLKDRQMWKKEPKSLRRKSQ